MYSTECKPSQPKAEGSSSGRHREHVRKQSDPLSCLRDRQPKQHQGRALARSATAVILGRTQGLVHQLVHRQVFVCGAWEALGLPNCSEDPESPKQIPPLGQNWKELVRVVA